MKLPKSSASYRARVRFGRYVLARLSRVKRDSESLRQALVAVVTAGRRLEDLENEVEERMAERDGADDDLDTTAKEARRLLAARSSEATTTAPYTAIFPEGIGYYTEATLEANAHRYGELKQRLEAHLDARDEVRKRHAPALGRQVAAFEEALGAVAAARTAVALARTTLSAAEENLDRLLVKLYGGLIAELGRTEAERFFPRARRSRGRAVDAPTT